MLTFLPLRQNPVLEQHNPSTYICNLATHERFRGRGVARALYEAVFVLPSKLASPFVAVRTWSTNDAHIGLLTKLGFHEVQRDSSGIDRIYYVRSV